MQEQSGQADKLKKSMSRFNLQELRSLLCTAPSAVASLEWPKRVAHQIFLMLWLLSVRRDGSTFESAAI